MLPCLFSAPSPCSFFFLVFANSPNLLHGIRSDIYIKRNYLWSSSSVVKRLKSILSVGTESCGGSFVHASMEQLSLNAGAMFFRSLVVGAASKKPSPLDQLEELLSLFHLGLELRRKFPQLLNHRRSEFYAAIDSGTLDVDWVT
ncbi:hypothetical protein T439DRAFT_93927 [Meredithblackwellia eburnea MCA 4105]